MTYNFLLLFESTFDNDHSFIQQEKKLMLLYFHTLLFAGCSKQDAIYIGQTYFKAWNSGSLTETIEEECIQNFMYQ